jgi:hypothetical protein
MMTTGLHTGIKKARSSVRASKMVGRPGLEPGTN